jgi:thymidine phosphorylase
MLPQEVIRKKRDGAVLSASEIADFVAGVTSGGVSDGQIAAFAMAVYFRGMDMAERVALTRAMTNSGATIDWTDLNLPGPIVDKHSTGGVGDTVSLMLAPMLAACGAYVPMISGRGLGHTGGTLDKLDSIPGYVSQPDRALFRSVVRRAGCAIIGQTADLAPADRRLYAIRDVTATVESIALITASILSKKLAAGLQALVMDVKMGSGAFMPTLEASRELAASIATVATGAGLPTVSMITDMNGPLASAAGSAIEVRFAIDYLTGDRRERRLHEVTIGLGSELLVLCGIADERKSAVSKLEMALTSGAAAERFERMIAELGGPKDLLKEPERRLPRAPVLMSANAGASGFISTIDVRTLGMAIVQLGGGRSNSADSIDPSVGLTQLRSVGDSVRAGEPLAIVHARDATSAALACDQVVKAYRIAEDAISAPSAILERISVNQ